MYEITIFYKEYVKRDSRNTGGWKDHKIVRRFDTEEEARAWEIGYKDSLNSEGYKLESRRMRDIGHGLDVFPQATMTDIMEAYKEYLANDKNWNY